jgi:tripartite-type tricarboxylate transporter receptor subunit TctC
MKRVVLVIAALAASSLANAQGWPTKPIRIVSQFTPGGPGDVLTRSIIQPLSQALGQPFVIEARPGAEGLIAAEACVKSAPDGYNLCVADSFAVSLLPVISPNMQFDMIKETLPIIHFGFLGSLLLVQNSVPANTLQELFELARQKPGTITWASWGPASSPYLYMEWLKRERGVSFLNVPYKAAPFGFQAIQAGEVQVAVFAAGPANAVVRAGKLKALAQTTPSRSTMLPGIPTLREAGLPVDVLTWFGMFAPAGTPRDVIQRANAETQKSFFGNQALVEKYLLTQGFGTSAPTGGSPEAFAAFLKQDRDSNVELARITGVKLDH